MKLGTLPLPPIASAILLKHFNNHNKCLMSNVWFLTVVDAGPPSIMMSQISPPFKLRGVITAFCIILSEGADRQMDTIQGPTPPLIHRSSVFSLMYTGPHELFRVRIHGKMLNCMKSENKSIALIFTQGDSLFLFITIFKLDYMLE